LGDDAKGSEEDFGAGVTFAGWRGHDPASDPFYARDERFNALVVNRAPVALNGAPRYWIYDEGGDVVKKDRFLGARTDLQPDQGFLVTWDFQLGGDDAPAGAYVVIGEFAGYQDRVRIVLRDP
jgi:hypothetical protein